MLCIGLMSGTSADGIDAALVNIIGSGERPEVQVLAAAGTPYSRELRSAVLHLCDSATASVSDLGVLGSVLGEAFAEAAHNVARGAGVPMSCVDVIGSHGQTVWHQPAPVIVDGLAGRGTLQIGCPAIIAARTGVPVVSDFRSADMAAGGQGAPLVPFADWVLLADDLENRAIQNIGGIANVTHLPAGCSAEEVLAFDTGPGNMVIDGLVRHITRGEMQCDMGGAWASRGRASLSALGDLIEADAYYRTCPPKSTGRAEYGADYLGRAVLPIGLRRGLCDDDLVATVTALTAETIGLAYDQWLQPRGGVATVVVGGGGIHNECLMSMLRRRLAPARIAGHEEFGLSSDSKEAVAFAILAFQTIRGRPGSLPSATGARHAAILGSITPAPGGGTIAAT